VIRVLAEQGAMDATELADRANILAPSLTRMLRSMTGRGLVLRAKDGQDARRLTLALGPAGAELIARVAPESERIYRDIEAAFGADRMAALLALLSDLAATQPPAAD
jgi:homoprotocatechuate degradation regulator HpaR